MVVVKSSLPFQICCVCVSVCTCRTQWSFSFSVLAPYPLFNSHRSINKKKKQMWGECERERCVDIKYLHISTIVYCILNLDQRYEKLLIWLCANFTFCNFSSFLTFSTLSLSNTESVHVFFLFYFGLMSELPSPFVKNIFVLKQTLQTNSIKEDTKRSDKIRTKNNFNQFNNTSDLVFVSFFFV